MIDNDQIETYLHRLGTPYDGIEDGFWVIKDEDGQIVVRHDPPLLVLRVKLADAPTANREKLFERLLQLNASDMISGAYGLENGAIVVVESLQSENLDYNEFQAAVDSLTLAMTTHLPELQSYLKA